MLGLLLIYFIGNYFYKLADKFDKHKWLFAILGVVTYYVGAMIGGVILALVDEFIGLGIDWDNDLVLTFLALPFAIGTCYLFYYLLKREWEKSIIPVKDEIQDIGKLHGETDNNTNPS